MFSMLRIDALRRSHIDANIHVVRFMIRKHLERSDIVKIDTMYKDDETDIIKSIHCNSSQSIN